MQTELTGKHIVVTGGFGALGGAVVAALLDRGATCHVPRHRGGGDAPAWARSDRAVVTAGVDLGDDAAVRAYYEALPSLWASVHAAGGFAMAPIADTSLADLERMWRVNAATCFACCREAVRALRRGGGGGRIVNVAARPAVEPAPGMVAYAASKAAVGAITRSVAAEVAGDGILVNAVLPSVFDTPANRAAMPGADHARWPTPTQIAEAVAYLCSERNQLTSGALIPVYGRM